MTATPDLHLMIATGQNLANLIPALQCSIREAWVLQTPAMQNSAGHLASALKARGIKVRRIGFDDSDVSTLHAQAAAIAEMLDGRSVTINLSGGTKLMTLALTQTLAAHLATGTTAETHLVYTDTEHRRLDWLGPSPRSETMVSVLKIDDVLLAQGYRRQPGGATESAERQREADTRAQYTRWLGDHAATLDRFFGAVNRLAQLAAPEGRPFVPRQELDYPPAREAAECLRRAAEARLLHWDGNIEVVFTGPDGARYMGGGWIEELAWSKAAGMRCDGDWAPSLRVQHVDSESRNEIDAALVNGNRLLIIECKAARAEDKVADWIYKLAQLTRQLGGAYGRALLLSARPLHLADLARAREYRVDVIAGAELTRLPQYLRDWMAG